ncbi:hypothetical protein SGLAM104S_07113 [Streptomyces glaucescens]
MQPLAVLDAGESPHLQQTGGGAGRRNDGGRPDGYSLRGGNRLIVRPAVRPGVGGSAPPGDHGRATYGDRKARAPGVSSRYVTLVA